MGGDWARAARMDREAHSSHGSHAWNEHERSSGGWHRQAPTGTGRAGGQARPGPGAAAEAMDLLNDVAAALGPAAVRHLLRPEVLRARAAADPKGVWARLLRLYEGEGRGFDPRGEQFHRWAEGGNNSGAPASKMELNRSREAFSEVWPRSVSLEERTRPGATDDLLHACVGRRTVGVVRGRTVPRIGPGGVTSASLPGPGEPQPQLATAAPTAPAAAAGGTVSDVTAAKGTVADGSAAGERAESMDKQQLRHE